MLERPSSRSSPGRFGSRTHDKWQHHGLRSCGRGDSRWNDSVAAGRRSSFSTDEAFDLIVGVAAGYVSLEDSAEMIASYLIKR